MEKETFKDTKETKNKTFSGICEKGKEIVQKKPRIFLLISGILAGLTLLFPVLGFLEWIVLIPAGIAVLLRASDKKIKLKTLYVDGVILFYSLYATCFHWFVALYPLEFIPGMSKFGAVVVVILGWFGLSLLQALISGFALVIIGVIFRSRVCEKAEILKPFALAGIWVIFEWFQTVGWWGVPWARLAIGQTFYLFGLQNASILGSYFVTFVITLVNFILAFAVIHPPKIKFGVALALSVILFQYCSGAFIWVLNDTESGEKIRVACIQGNVSSNQQWDADTLETSLQNYSKYTQSAAKEGAELVIWPETAFPYRVDSDYFSYYSDEFAKLAKDNGIYLLVGGYSTGKNSELLNSLICYKPNGEVHDTVYSKRHLVPFGEYTPLKTLIVTLLPPLAELMLTSEEIQPGEGAKIIELDNGVSVGGLICFDSIYEELTLESVRGGADIFCLSTNDSWFRDSLAIYMHNAQAQIRAVESGKYIARAANTGISTVINSRGEVVDELPPLVGGIIVRDIYANEGRTVGSVIGNTFVYVIMAGFVAIFVADFVLKKSKKVLTKQCFRDKI